MAVIELNDIEQCKSVVHSLHAYEKALLSALYVTAQVMMAASNTNFGVAILSLAKCLFPNVSFPIDSFFFVFSLCDEFLGSYMATFKKAAFARVPIDKLPNRYQTVDDWRVMFLSPPLFPSQDTTLFDRLLPYVPPPSAAPPEA